MTIDEFVRNFRAFCDNKYGTQNGTAASYANALRYLLAYLHIDQVNESTILTIKSIEPDIRDKSGIFYGDMLSSFEYNGRASYVEKGFVKAAIRSLREFLSVSPLPPDSINDDIIVEAVKDSNIIALFKPDKTKQKFPLSRPIEHSYDIRQINGTAKDSIKRIYSGRKAEKYFISYLKDYLGLKPGIEFIDVSNSKDYGYDIRVFEYGIEVKNIKSGGFYLTDNEIARLLCSQTHLVFVDIDNGIWLLKNNSRWLKKVIENIKSVRQYCCANYDLLDLTDIRINFDLEIISEITEISQIGKTQFEDLLNG